MAIHTSLVALIQGSIGHKVFLDDEVMNFENHVCELRGQELYER